MFADVSKEYEKDSDLKREDVRALLDWSEKQPHLPEIEELEAILFLQSCYYSNELAKTTIDNFFTVRTLCGDLFQNRNPSISPLKEHLKVLVFKVLPGATPEGYDVIFNKLLDPNPDHFNFGSAIKMFDMVTLEHLYMNGTSKGHVLAVDMKGCAFGHVTRLSPLLIKKYLYFLQDAMPLRLKGVHFFNIVPFIDTVLALMKPFMKKELMSMLHFHDDVSSLTKFIPLKCLPSEYGGQAESTLILQEKMEAKLLDNMNFFEWQDNQVVDESRRPGEPKNVGDVFGVEGTFKKLELD